jgi:predicted transcriptional regulator
MSDLNQQEEVERKAEFVLNFQSGRAQSLVSVVGKARNRNRVQIVANLLSAARQGALKTHLMNRANLSFAMASQYIYNLLSTGLMVERIDEETTERYYVTTPKGYKFLEMFENLEQLVGSSFSRESLDDFAPAIRNNGAEKKEEAKSYKVCLNCEPHPSYPDIHPVTLHKGEECLNCGKASQVSLSNSSRDFSRWL